MMTIGYNNALQIYNDLTSSSLGLDLDLAWEIPPESFARCPDRRAGDYFEPCGYLVGSPGIAAKRIHYRNG
jgi:hypothetical protein